MIVTTPRLLEAEVQAQIIQAAAMLGLDLDRQNTAQGENPNGQKIRFGKPGNSDLTGMLPGGRKLDIECKRQGWNPNKITGKDKIRFERQLARLQRTNDQGGVGFWTDDSVQCLEILQIVIKGGWVEEPGYGQLIVHREPRKEV